MCIGLASADLDERFILEDIGSQVATIHTASVDTDGAGAFIYFRAWGMAINHKGGAMPMVGPSAGARGFGAFRGASVGIDHLYVGRYIDALHVPCLVR